MGPMDIESPCIIILINEPNLVVSMIIIPIDRILYNKNIK